MKNIFAVIAGDMKRISTNIVAIVILAGIMVLPCLYAWFNIFSNWAPYDADATGRIKVAVASADEGTKVLGLELNVGDSVVNALKTNDTIGWQFYDTTEEALDQVYSSDCYAALIIPEDFTSNVTSFLSGEITQPEILYYQNDKKNAIAPKITEKAKTAVQQQVNATFVQTIADDIASLVSMAKANGISAEDLLKDLSSDIDDLNLKLEDCSAALTAANGLTNAARNLISVSVRLTQSTASTLDSSRDLLNKTQNDAATIDSRIDNTTSSVAASLNQADADLAAIGSSLEASFSDMNRYNDYVTSRLSSDVAMLDSFSTNCRDMANAFSSINFNAAAAQMNGLSTALSNLSARIGSLEQANEESWAGIREQQQSIMDEINSARATVQSVSSTVSSDLPAKLHSALGTAQGAAGNVGNILASLENSTSALGGTLSSYLSSMGGLQGGFGDTTRAIQAAQKELSAISEMLKALASSQMLAEVVDALEDDGDLLGDYLATPIKMDTVVKYDMGNYGSAMSPFYTVLSQWVCALLLAAFVKVPIRPEHAPSGLRMPQAFFGRLGLFLIVGLGQAIIVSLGDLWYTQIQCLHPWRFFFAVLLTGVCYSLINYSLVFALDKIGMAISVIVMVLQVGGSGGTYPVEVLPEFFQKIYDFMPFKYSMLAIRETIGGMYGNTYAHNMLILALICLGAIVFGLALYYPFRGLNRAISKSAKRSEIMV